MPRRETRWWSALASTPADALLRRWQGVWLVRLLADWWIAGEGILDGSYLFVEHGASVVRQRYSEDEFYQLLARATYADLSDRDEWAVDAVFESFAGWAASRKARELIATLADDEQVRVRVRKMVRAAAPDSTSSEAGADSDGREVEAELHRYVQAHVYHAIVQSIRGSTRTRRGFFSLVDIFS